MKRAVAFRPQSPLIALCRESILNRQKIQAAIEQTTEKQELGMALAVLCTHHKAMTEESLAIAEALLAKGAACDLDAHILHPAAQNGFINVLNHFFGAIRLDEEYHGSTLAWKFLAFTPYSDAKLLFLKRMLAAGLNPNQQDAVNKNSLLHWAVIRGELETAEVLLAAGADINAQNYRKQTPAMALITCKDNASKLKLYPKLLAFPTIRLEIEDDNGNTVLHFAAKYGQDLYAAALLRTGANVHAVNLAHKTASGLADPNTPTITVFKDWLQEHPEAFSLFKAEMAACIAETNYPSLIEEKWQAIVTMDLATDREPRLVDLLHFAAELNDGWLIAKLNELGLDLNARLNGRTALHAAATRNSMQALKALLDLGADISAKNEAGLTALDIAIQSAFDASIAVFGLREETVKDLVQAKQIKYLERILQSLAPGEAQKQCAQSMLDTANSLEDPRTKNTIARFVFAYGAKLKKTSISEEERAKILAELMAEPEVVVKTKKIAKKRTNPSMTAPKKQVRFF